MPLPPPPPPPWPLLLLPPPPPLLLLLLLLRWVDYIVHGLLLQREAEALRKMINCNVCHQRQVGEAACRCCWVN